MTGHPPPLLTAEQIATLTTVSGVTLTEDGRLVAWTEQGVTKEKAAKSLPAAVWVSDRDGARPARNWTPGPGSHRAPRFSPDGRWLALLSDRLEAGTWQIWRIPTAGGEAEQVTTWAGGVVDFAWSPDARHIAFTAPDEAWAREQKEREQRGDDVQVWGERLGFARLRLVTPGDPNVVTLGPADRHITGLCWHPSGAEVAVAATERPDLDAPDALGTAIFALAVNGSGMRHLCRFSAGVQRLTFTQDGAGLLFTGWEAGRAPSSSALWQVSAAGGVPRCLTTGLDGCVTGITAPAGDDACHLTVAEALTTRVYHLDPVTGRRTRRWQSAGGAATEWAAAAGGRNAAVVWSDGVTPARVYAVDSGGTLRPLSPHHTALATVPWQPQHPFAWTAPDGLHLDGVMIEPRNATARPPAVVLVHGGPYGRWMDGFNLGPTNWAQWLAMHGYAVFLPNPRGGAGHGHQFAATVAGEVGRGDWLDVLSGTRAFLAASGVDGARLGIGGWSQGGFMTNWALSGGVDAGAARGWDPSFTRWSQATNDLFRAGVAGAGPSDWGALYQESDLPEFESMLGGSTPGDGLGPLRHHLLSPVTYAARVHTPLLLLHGERDPRVPVGQAMAMFQELHRRGNPTDLVLYPREPHGIQERAHVVDMLTRVREWFDRWLRG